MIIIFDVICIGAALVDMVAQVGRHPENDDEVFVSNLSLFSGGAAANTAYACAKLGLRTAFIGKLGRSDVFGTKILDDFHEGKVNTKYIKYSEKFPTGSAYVALNTEGERRIYAHSGAANYLSKEDIKEEEVANTHLIFLSSLKNIEGFIEAALIGRRNKIPVILNPGMLIIEQGLLNIETILNKIDVLIMSQRESKKLVNFNKNNLNLKTINEDCITIFSLGVRCIIITLGEDGALLITQKDSEIIPSIKPETVVDTTGAGDAFSAGFIYGFHQNPGFNFETLKKNVRIGNFVASKCIGKLGARNGIPKQIEI
ncbi:MAG: carbohydrate kinase family protein [Promethearchaeota archaeon]